MEILGRADGEAEDIAEYLQEEGEVARMLDVHKQAAQAQHLLKGDPSDDVLLSGVVSLAESIMAALEAAGRKDDGNYHLRNIIRGDHNDPADRAMDMQEVNEMFTQTTLHFIFIVVSEIEHVKNAFKSP